MPQSERQRVWKGMLKKTSGGLTKADLVKNKRGKIVSKKKSAAAKKNKENNLGQWLRSKGDHFLSKGLKAENIVKKGKPGRKAFEKEAPKIAVKPKPVVKKKAQPKPKPVVKKKKPVVKKAPPKITKSEPIKTGEDKNPAKVSVGNIVVKGQESSAAQQKKIEEYEDKAFELEEQGLYQKQIVARLGPPPKGFKW